MAEAKSQQSTYMYAVDAVQVVAKLGDGLPGVLLSTSGSHETLHVW